MIGELGSMIAGFISGRAVDADNKTKVWTSIIIGSLFFLTNFVVDRFEHVPITVEGILVLFALSLLLILIAYGFLALSNKKSNK